jgi:DNA-binding protein HU-beta
MAMTKAQLVNALADKVEVNKKQAAAFLEELSKLSYKEAKNGFTIPGIGKLVVVNRKARLGRNPKTGETIAFLDTACDTDGALFRMS